MAETRQLYHWTIPTNANTAAMITGPAQEAQILGGSIWRTSSSGAADIHFEICADTRADPQQWIKVQEYGLGGANEGSRRTINPSNFGNIHLGPHQGFRLVRENNDQPCDACLGIITWTRR